MHPIIGKTNYILNEFSAGDWNAFIPVHPKKKALSHSLCSHWIEDGQDNRSTLKYQTFEMCTEVREIIFLVSLMMTQK